MTISQLSITLINNIFLGENRVTTPTTTESVLPWKRDDKEGENGAIQQTEFPSWANNKVIQTYYVKINLQ